MISISRTWRKFSKQLKTNLHKKMPIKTIESRPNKSHKSVRFNAIDTVYFTHSSSEYDRTPSEESYDLPKNYIPKSIGTQRFELSVDKYPVNIPNSYKKDKGWEKTTSLSIKYSTTSEKQTDIIIEGIVVECQLREAAGGGWISTDNDLIVGIPWSIFDWILNETLAKTEKNIHYEYKSKNQEHVWLELRHLPEHTAKREVICKVYKSESKQFVPMGTLVEACNQLKSNILGYGQFSIFITKNDYLEFYLTGFQLVNVSAIQSFPQPEIEMPPPDYIVKKLSNNWN